MKVVKMFSLVLVVVMLSSGLLSGSSHHSGPVKFSVSKEAILKEEGGNRPPAFWLGQDYPEGKVMVGFYNTGEFIMNTYEGRSLLYPYDVMGCTSSWTFQVNGQNYVSHNGQVNGYIVNAMHEVQDGTHRNASIEYQFGTVHVAVNYYIITNTTKIMINVTNTGGGPATFGARYLYDTCNGDPNQYDGSPILIPKATGNVTYNHEDSFTHIDITQYPNEGFKYFCGLENPNSQHPEFWSTGYLGPDHEATVPDKLTLAYWAQAYQSTWEYAPNTNLVFTDPAMTGGYPDSCVLVYWNPKTLQAGETWNITTYFGNGVPPLFDYRDLRIMKSDSETTLIHHVQPGGMTTYNLTVMNLGTVAGTVKLEIPQELKDGWNATLSEDEFSLKSLEKKDIVLTVRAPRDNLDFGEFQNVSVHGYFIEEEDIEDREDTVTIVDLIYDLELEFSGDIYQTDDNGDKIPVSQISPGETKRFTLSLTNMGNMNDTFHLELEDPGNGWTAKFLNEENPYILDVNLTAPYYGDSHTTFLVEVTAPVTVDANTIQDILVTGTSLMDPHPQPATAVGTLRLIVGASSQLVLSLAEGEEDKKYLYPGDSITFRLSALNQGNVKIDVDMHIQGPFITASESTEEDWAVEIQPEKFSLNPMARSDSVIVTVHAPKKSLSGKMITIQVFGRASSEDSGVSGARSKDVFLSAVIKPVSNFTAFFKDNSTVEVMPGEEASLEITVANTGNTPISLYPMVGDMPNLWEFAFQDTDGMDITDMSVDPYTEQDILFTFTPTSSTETGTHDLILNISSESAGFVLIQTKVHVGQIFGVSAEPITTDAEISPGMSTTYSVYVMNGGNGEDTFQLEINDVPSGWYAYVFSFVTSRPVQNTTSLNFNTTPRLCDVPPGTEVTDNSTALESKMDFVLGPNQGVEVLIAIVSPKNAEAKIFNFGVTVKSLGGGMEDKDNLFNISVKRCDVTITRIECKSDLEKGEITTIIVYVKNIGDIAAYNVDITLYADGKEIGGTTLATIMPGNTQMATVTWRSSGDGDVKITAKADPDNKISELNEKNNVKDQKVTVSGSSVFDMPGYEILMAVASVGWAATLSRRKRRA